MNTVFVGGSRHVSRLPAEFKNRLNSVIKHGHKVVVGDANGADKAVQRHLLEAAYDNVIVFCSGERCRNNLGSWKACHISPPKSAKGFHFYAEKDRAMAREADFGLMIWDGKSPGTILNVLRLVRSHKIAVLFNATDKSSFNIKSLEHWNDFLSTCSATLLADLRDRASPSEWGHSNDQQTLLDLVGSKSTSGRLEKNESSTPAKSKQQFDPKELFLQAESFALTQNVLLRPEMTKYVAYTGAPAVVLSAFAAELFLKCLLLLQKSAGWGHDLEKLFNALTPVTRERVAANWKAILERKKDQYLGEKYDLEESLKVAANAFDAVRYAHEGVEDVHFNLSDFPEALRTTIIEAKPEWADLRRVYHADAEGENIKVRFADRATASK